MLYCLYTVYGKKRSQQYFNFGPFVTLVLCNTYPISLCMCLNWWFSDAKLMERFPEIESEGKSGKPVIDFDEPHEWLAVLSSSDQQQNHQTNPRTPLMTPKKVVRPNAAVGEQDSGKLLSPQHETVMGDGQLHQSNSFQFSDELAEDNIVASVVVDVNKEGIHLSDSDMNEMGGMMVSLSVELAPADVGVPSSDETVGVTLSPAKALAGGHRCKTSTVNHQNCSLKHAHSRTHSYKTGRL